MSEAPTVAVVSSVGADQETGPQGDGVCRITGEMRASWIGENASRFDLMHVTRCPDDISMADFRDAVELLEQLGKPLAFTAPGSGTSLSPMHREIESALAQRADRVIVHTYQARADVSDEHGRDALVIQHPGVLPPEAAESLPRPRRIPPFTIGIVLCSLAPDPISETLVEVMAEQARESSCFKARVDVEADARRPEKHPGNLVPLLSGLSKRDLVDLRLPAKIGRAEIIDFVSEVDLVMVPAWTGRQCEWSGAFKDAGLPILSPDGPDCDQLRNGFAFKVFPTGTPDRESVRDAITRAQVAITSGRIEPEGVDRRRHRDRVVAASYRNLYSDLMTAARGNENARADAEPATEALPVSR